jgi:hypothetical protein
MRAIRPAFAVIFVADYRFGATLASCLHPVLGVVPPCDLVAGGLPRSRWTGSGRRRWRGGCWTRLSSSLAVRCWNTCRWSGAWWPMPSGAGRSRRRSVIWTSRWTPWGGGWPNSACGPGLHARRPRSGLRGAADAGCQCNDRARGVRLDRRRAAAAGSAAERVAVNRGG